VTTTPYRSTTETYDDDYEIVMTRAMSIGLLAHLDDEEETDNQGWELMGGPAWRADEIGGLLNQTWEEGVTLDEWLARAVADAHA